MLRFRPMNWNSRVWLTVFAAAAMVNGILSIPFLIGGFEHSRDFSAFYTAGKILNYGQAGQLYDLNLQRHFYPQNPEIFLPFYHPPFEALLFSLFSPLPFFDAYLCWNLFNLLLLFFTSHLFYRCYIIPSSKDPDKPSRSPFTSPFLIFIAFLSFFPTWDALLNGQNSIFYFFLLVASLYLFRLQNKHFASGFVLGCTLFKPQLTLPLSVGLGIRKGRLFFWGFLVSMLFWGCVSLGMIGIQGALMGWQMFRQTSSDAKTFGYDYEVMANVRGLLERILPFADHRAMIAISIAYGLITLAVIGWINARKGPGSNFSDTKDKFLDIQSILLIVLASYHLHTHDLLILALPFMLLTHESMKKPYLLSIPAQKWPLVVVPFCTLSLFTPLSIYFFLKAKDFLIFLQVLLFCASFALLRLAQQSQMGGKNERK